MNRREINAIRLGNTVIAVHHLLKRADPVRCAKLFDRAGRRSTSQARTVSHAPAVNKSGDQPGGKSVSGAGGIHTPDPLHSGDPQNPLFRSDKTSLISDLDNCCCNSRVHKHTYILFRVLFAGQKKDFLVVGNDHINIGKKNPQIVKGFSVLGPCDIDNKCLSRRLQISKKLFHFSDSKAGRNKNAGE